MLACLLTRVADSLVEASIVEEIAPNDLYVSLQAHHHVFSHIEGANQTLSSCNLAFTTV